MKNCAKLFRLETLSLFGTFARVQKRSFYPLPVFIAHIQINIFTIPIEKRLHLTEKKLFPRDPSVPLLFNLSDN